MSNPKGMVVKVLLAYGPDCDCSMAWLRATAVAGILAASRRVVRHDRTARSWSWEYCLVVVGGNMRSK